MTITRNSLPARIEEIVSTYFPPGTRLESFRKDPEGDGWFVMLDDPTNEFEFVEIYVNADGSWES